MLAYWLGAFPVTRLNMAMNTKLYYRQARCDVDQRDTVGQHANSYEGANVVASLLEDVSPRDLSARV